MKQFIFFSLIYKIILVGIKNQNQTDFKKPNIKKKINFRVIS